MNTNEYIKAVLGHIKNKSYLAVIEQELKNHIDDRTDYYKEIGYDEEVSLQKAMEHIGSPDDVGEQMNRLHNSKRLNTAITVLGIIAAFVIGLYGYVSYDWFGGYSSTVFTLRHYFIISLAFLALLMCYSAMFCISVKTRISKRVGGIADSAIFIPLFLFIYSQNYLSDLNLAVLKGLTISDMIIDVNAAKQLVILFFYYVVAVFLLTSAVSFCMFAEFRSFEMGKANMQIIYNGEKYKYFLYIANIIAVIFIAFIAVGYFSSIR
ncbi:MAG: permease prefix domain 1-containing protein [Acetobacter sp.]|nr:permease prefix domain 1-containing protein [Bacteroides sp.]MCM1341509.1 permease prefix domain 1-containing protein [Acetobacter sp.]MCM1433703.1 permease prefix domain 1-containing protein [Clostridiales bacterium]